MPHCNLLHVCAVVGAVTRAGAAISLLVACAGPSEIGSVVADNVAGVAAADITAATPDASSRWADAPSPWDARVGADSAVGPDGAVGSDGADAHDALPEAGAGSGDASLDETAQGAGDVDQDAGQAAQDASGPDDADDSAAAVDVDAVGDDAVGDDAVGDDAVGDDAVGDDAVGEDADGSESEPDAGGQAGGEEDVAVDAGQQSDAETEIAEPALAPQVASAKAEGAAAGPRVAFTATVPADGSVAVEVALRDLQGVYGVAGHLRYDPEALEAVEIVAHDVLTGPGYVSRSLAALSMPGRIVVGAARFQLGSSKKGLVGTDVDVATWVSMRFVAKKTGIHTLSFEPSRRVALAASKKPIDLVWGSLNLIAVSEAP